MCDDLNKVDHFIVQEYLSATQLTFHNDELRSRLSSFYLTIAGSIVAIIVVLAETGFDFSATANYSIQAAIFLSAIGLLGILIVAVIARIRRVQLEYYRIINNIRGYFLENNIALWNIVELSSDTIPSPNRKSGTYLWTLSIMIISSSLIAAGSYFSGIKYLSYHWQILIPILILIAMIFLQDFMYRRLAIPPSARVYESSPNTIELGDDE